MAENRSNTGSEGDTFFIPEVTGFIIDSATDVKVRVSVGSSGKAVIEDLIVDGMPFDPTLPAKTISQKPPLPIPNQPVTEPPEITETPEPEFPPVSPIRK
jgi:hypothetical protein